MDASNSAPIRVLTVDDSASMRALLLGALTSRGFAVEQCEDGQEARRAFLEKRKPSWG